ncbi:MAG: ATP-dependent Clp protease proteolytic subunit [Patescibacteria group bacterium]
MHLNQEELALLSRGIVDLHGNVTGDTFEYVRDCLTSLAAKDYPDITVWITSDGGNIDAGLNIYDILRNYPGRVTGLVIGSARSIALVILQACNERQAHTNSTVFLHDPVYMVGHSILAQCVRTQDTGEFDIMRQRMIDILVAKSKLSRREVVKMCRQKTNLYADKAKKAGWIDTLL